MNKKLKLIGYKVLFIVCFFCQNVFCQNTNILKLPFELNNIRVGEKLDSVEFTPIRSYSFKEALNKGFFIYKIDYIYSGKKITILDSVKVQNLLIGTNKEGIIQSIIISCKNNNLLRDYFFSLFGHNAAITSSSIGQSSHEIYLWKKDNYCISVKASTNLTGEENNTIIVLFDCDYIHLFRKELTDSISTTNY